MADFGSCWSAGPYLTQPAKKASGFLVVGQAIARRWSTPRGRLIDDPNYGTDVTDAVNGDFAPSDIARLQVQLALEAEKDERVLSCSVRVTLSSPQAQRRTLTVTGTVQTAGGPFVLVVSVDQVSVALLQIAEAA